MHAGMVTSDELRLNLRREHAANTLCKTCTAFEVSAFGMPRAFHVPV